MTTYWQASVSVNGQTKVVFCEDSLADTLARAVADAIYYQAQYPEQRITYSLEETCAACHNSGTVAARGKRSKRVKCKACKGDGAPGRIENIPFAMPNPANRITLAVA